MVKLVADEGMMLTNGESYGKEVYLGANDNPENWREISQAEYEAMTEVDSNETLGDSAV